MRSIRVLITGLAATSAALLVAGCGREGEQPGTTATVGKGDPIEVTGSDYAFDPEAVVVEGGKAPVQVTLDNRGSLPHNLTVFEGEAQVGATSTIEGGESDAASLELRPGSYRMVCTVGDHEELGMVGELEVR